MLTISHGRTDIVVWKGGINVVFVVAVVVVVVVVRVVVVSANESNEMCD